MQEYYDIVIIGAGPAGLNAGLHAIGAQPQASILLVDKVAPWEHPIECAEAVGRSGFESAIEVRPQWIVREIKAACFHAPDHSHIRYVDRKGGCIIDRAGMQRDIAHDLIDRGVTADFSRRAVHISAMKSFRRTVEFDDGSTVVSRVVVDASGPVACLGREDDLQRKPCDLEPALFVVAQGARLDDDAIHLYLGQKVAPGGYAWAFPRGTDGEANIGIVIGSDFKGRTNLRTLLNDFLQEHFPGVAITNTFAGAIPCGSSAGPFAAPGLFKTGDAASTVNPISRAGIVEALVCGGMAGDHAAQMLQAATEREFRNIAAHYEAAWHKNRGKRHEKLSKVKKILAEVPDADYNRAARSLAQMSSDNLSMFQIFKTALSRFPRLIWGLRHLI